MLIIHRVTRILFIFSFIALLLTSAFFIAKDFFDKEYPLYWAIILIGAIFFFAALGKIGEGALNRREKKLKNHSRAMKELRYTDF